MVGVTSVRSREESAKSLISMMVGQEVEFRKIELKKGYTEAESADGMQIYVVSSPRISEISLEEQKSLMLKRMAELLEKGYIGVNGITNPDTSHGHYGFVMRNGK